MNEYWPFTSVVLVRPPRATVAPAIGAPPDVAVTVPESVPPAPTGVHEGNANEPIRVWWLSPSTA